ncbi:PorP/SprF family type IX secretion system membrane protein [Xanthomarina sp. F1114]|uniref:PorP/SprF family type IX secretion system membrane protein n=1 Tax=Xanthomarina sp. F1114 TaxID=2996019 RepID=UPI00225E0323|nr:PorP/SprF family type IX secretion system membrane protein [Xanthomarina sp. F1114]MCX7547300.1 PorP/SprF family type IX secretion system membrane protein [Xanthomarina sp. F1114]
MKTLLLIIVLFFCSIQFSFSQEDGVVSLAIPVRSSLKFNRYIINPTFSFVREQNTYINITNKREWGQFDDAPQTYLINYSGRFKENIGVGVGLFQQNHGVLTTFGGLVNLAYNAQLQTDSNLTFGLNIGFYKSSINDGKVVVNQPDPSLDNIPNNMVLSVSPGINYGLVFFDFGLSVNNLVQYNFKSSELLKKDPQQSIQAHLMYTGYMSSRGFFDESKFSALVKSEFEKDQTIFSGIAMLMVPKGIWAQAGYNSVYGFTGGLGINITKQIAVEYNYEKAVGDLSTFGASHEFTLAYKFESRDKYYYSGDDREEALLMKDKKRKPGISTKPKMSAEERAQVTEERARERAAAQEQARLAAEERAQARKSAQEAAQLNSEEKAKAITEAQTVAATQAEAAEAQANEEARLAAEAAAQAQANEEARLAVEAAAQAQANEEARLAAEAAAQAQAEEEARLVAEAAAQAQAEEEARLAAEAAAQAQANEEARLAAEAAAQAQANEEARLAAEAAAQAQADEEARLAAEAAAQAQADEEARLAAEAAAQAQAEEEARLVAEAAAQAQANEEARLAAEAAAIAQAVPVQPDVQVTQKDELAKSMFALTESTKESKEQQEELLQRFDDVIAIKDQDLKDLREENDLSEQGIYLEPKPFKSITAENRALAALRADLDRAMEERSKTIKELEELYIQRIQKGSNKNDATSKYYLETIKGIREEQKQSEKVKARLVSTLETINVQTEIERKRRIKRAQYDNEKDRYIKDRTALERIIESTPISSETLTAEDFDFGEKQTSNVQILKGVQNVENGFYMIIAVHNNAKDRDAFLEKVVSTGQKNINFFFDVNSSKYFIYYQKFDYVEEAMNKLQTKGDKPYNGNMSVVKIEN